MIRLLRAALCACLLCVLGCQSPQVAPEQPVPRQRDVIADAVRNAVNLFGAAALQDDYLHDWQAAIHGVAADHARQVYPLLNELISSARFDDLTQPQQHAALLLTALIGMFQSDNAYVYHLLVRSTAMPDAVAMDWVARLNVAKDLGNRDDALLALANLLSRWPRNARTLQPDAMRRLVGPEPQNDAQRAARFAALNALFDVSFKAEEGVEPDGLWLDLTQELVQRGDLARAGRVVARIYGPRSLLAMQVDRRFDELVRRHPREFDLRSASERYRAEFADAVKRHPRSLHAIVQLAAAYMDIGRDADAIALLRDAVAPTAAASDVKVRYDDGPDHLHWAYGSRAEGLKRLRLWDEAEWQYQVAADTPEHGAPNVDDVIDLAAFYANQKRPDAALQMLARLPQRPDALSPYGTMRVYAVRQRAALTRHDTLEAANCLAFLRDHQQDALDTYQWALVSADHLDEAAQLLIQRLQTPTLRRDALLDVQDYLPIGEPPLSQENDARWERLVKRPGVTAAIAAVGRREKAALPPEP